MKKTNTGISLVEVLIASVVIGVALIPLLSLGQSETRQANFNEQQLLGRYRARRVAECLAVYGYDALVVMSGATSLAPKANLPIPLPQINDELLALAKSDSSLTFLKHFSKKMSFYQEIATLEVIEPGLARISITVKWRLPSEAKAMKTHKIIFSKLVCRRDESFCSRHNIVRAN